MKKFNTQKIKFISVSILMDIIIAGGITYGIYLVKTFEGYRWTKTIMIFGCIVFSVSLIYALILQIITFMEYHKEKKRGE